MGSQKNEYLINGVQEPARGPSSLFLATVTLGIVAIIAVGGLTYL